MITAIKHDKPYTGEGDIDIYGLAHHILPATDSDSHFVPIELFSLNPWDGIWKAGVDIISLKQQLLCPYSNLAYDAWVPTHIITDTPELWPVPDHFVKMACDKSWTDGLKPDSLDGVVDPLDLSSIVQSMLGTGYQLGNGPHDGYCEASWFVVELTNGDKILGPGNVWYNK